MAVNPSISIQPEDILDIVRQMSSQSSFSPIDESSQLARIDASKSLPDKGKYCPSPHTPSRPINSPSPIASHSDDWKKKWLTSKNPCFHCGEAGHWAPDCPMRRKGAMARAQSSQ
ncbi:hypothetical protein O181_077790 [Austropuccinia psidii MF-1]|uniref:CCHC-type domain-containing protein n=1 Tax=Austropuccinia psidii MF-1 TaxID=1389203 RepID=A0A9Q3IGB4_9BASI|nr:hypothetical protein [Austropuccinia psidii MF-1]